MVALGNKYELMLGIKSATECHHKDQGQIYTLSNFDSLGG